MNKLIHTPEGVRDIYGSELYRRKETYSRILEVMESFGYMGIKLPSFEYYDIFSKKVGTSDTRELYKFFDKENNTLVLRPDFTPGAARACAKYFIHEKLPVRLTYYGSVYNNLSGLQGKLKEATQVGAELMGEHSVAADAEAVALNISCLKSCKLSDFRLTLGHVDFILGICEEAGLESDIIDELSVEISVKNRFAIEEILGRVSIAKEYKDLICDITFMFGDAAVLDKAEGLVKNERSLAAIRRLRELYGLLERYGVSERVYFDLGMFSKYRYYTGIIFRAYAQGAGEPVSKGGRYDNLIEKFGTRAAAVGFVIDIDKLMQALEKGGEPSSDMKSGAILVYDEDSIARAISFASDARSRGENIELIPYTGSEDYEAYIPFGKRTFIKEVYFAIGGKVIKKL